ncbi:MAG: FkbM family methyltransferase [Patescibacteria group bacterium]|jgi:hypothetical protein
MRGLIDRLFGKAQSARLYDGLAVVRELWKNKQGYVLRNSAEYEFASRFVSYISREDMDAQWHGVLRGLDTESIIVAESIISRYFYLFTHNLIDKKLFTADERALHKIDVVPQKYHGLWKHSFPLEPSVFFYDNGLKFVPPACHNTLLATTVVDGGGYMGDSAYIFSEKYHCKAVHSFEPDKAVFKKGVENIRALKLSTVHMHNRALGSKKPAITIDDFSGKLALPVGLIKLDIEGAEYEVIRGAKKTIKKDVPILSVALYHRPEDFFLIKPLIESYAPGKYRFMIRKLNPYHLVFETFLIAWPK